MARSSLPKPEMLERYARTAWTVGYEVVSVQTTPDGGSIVTYSMANTTNDVPETTPFDSWKAKRGDP